MSDETQEQRSETASASGEPVPRTIYIIRHGEKPEGEKHGVTIDGERSESSLIPRGWQRAGAIPRLFDPFQSAPRPGFATPEELWAPGYPKGSTNHRTYETIVPLSELTGTEINTSFTEGQEEALAQIVSHPGIGVALISWEHTAIPTIAKHILGVLNPNDIPTKWDGTRFDVVWSFVRQAGYGGYLFSQLPQMLLAGDKETPITAA